MKNILKFLILLIVVVCLSACFRTKPAGTISLHNHSNDTLIDAQIIISRDSVKSIVGEIPAIKIPCIEDSTGTFVPSQVDDIDGDGQWDELAFVYNLQPKQTITLDLFFLDEKDIPHFTKRTQAHFGKKIGADPVISITHEVLKKAPLPRGMGYPYKTDGPTWENDMVGYRHYFDGRNCRDFFCKRLPVMVLDTVGIWPDGTIGDTYHTLKLWGRDVLGVGKSFGLGGIAVLFGDSLVRLGVLQTDSVDNSDSTVFTLVSNGPVRSMIKLDNYGWDIGGKKLNVHQLISIWAGRYVYENKVWLEGDTSSVRLVTGIVHSNDSNKLKIINYPPNLIGFYTHDKQTYNREFYMGLGLLLPNSEYLGEFDTPMQGNGILYTYCARLKAPVNKLLTYYAMAACEIKDEKFCNVEDFLKVLNTEASIINNPVGVKLSKPLK